MAVIAVHLSLLRPMTAPEIHSGFAFFLGLDFGSIAGSGFLAWTDAFVACAGKSSTFQSKIKKWFK